jgi:hypothetical protein
MSSNGVQAMYIRRYPVLNDEWHLFMSNSAKQGLQRLIAPSHFSTPSLWLLTVYFPHSSFSYSSSRLTCMYPNCHFHSFGTYVISPFSLSFLKPKPKVFGTHGLPIIRLPPRNSSGRLLIVIFLSPCMGIPSLRIESKCCWRRGC